MQVGVEASMIKKFVVSLINFQIFKKFVVYGELMCNPGIQGSRNPRLYDYETNGVSKTFQLFGIMMETDLELQDEIHGKVKAAGYTVLKKTEKKLPTEEVQNANGQAVEEFDQQTVVEEKTPFMQICFNRTFQNLAQQLNYPTVPLVGEYESFYDAVMANSKWMLEGLGEGMMVISQEYIKKWKIGAEKNISNVRLIDSVLEQIKQDRNLCGDKTAEIV